MKFRHCRVCERGFGSKANNLVLYYSSTCLPEVIQNQNSCHLSESDTVVISENGFKRHSHTNTWVSPQIRDNKSDFTTNFVFFEKNS